MARAYNTIFGTVVVENMLSDSCDEVVYIGYLLDVNGKPNEYSYRQMPRHDKGSESDMRRLRKDCVSCVVSCYKIYLAQQDECRKCPRRVSFKRDLVEVKYYNREEKTSRQDKIREWDEFGKVARCLGLCQPDTQEDLFWDALIDKVSPR